MSVRRLFGNSVELLHNQRGGQRVVIARLSSILRTVEKVLSSFNGGGKKKRNAN